MLTAFTGRNNSAITPSAGTVLQGSQWTLTCIISCIMTKFIEDAQAAIRGVVRDCVAIQHLSTERVTLVQLVCRLVCNICTAVQIDGRIIITTKYRIGGWVESIMDGYVQFVCFHAVRISRPKKGDECRSTTTQKNSQYFEDRWLC